MITVKQLSIRYHHTKENIHGKGYFLGSIICINEKKDYLEVIDGEQRLTTISILLITIYGIIDNAVDRNIINLKDKKYRKPFDNLEDLIIKDGKVKLELSIQNQNNELVKLMNILKID